jgi:hypothetical protein
VDYLSLSFPCDSERYGTATRFQKAVPSFRYPNLLISRTGHRDEPLWRPVCLLSASMFLACHTFSFPLCLSLLLFFSCVFCRVKGGECYVDGMECETRLALRFPSGLPTLTPRLRHEKNARLLFAAWRNFAEQAPRLPGS